MKRNKYHKICFYFVNSTPVPINTRIFPSYKKHWKFRFGSIEQQSNLYIKGTHGNLKMCPLYIG